MGRMTSFAPPSPPLIKARHFGGSQTPRAIVIHGTVSPDRPGTARSIAAWWHGQTSPLTSAHYIVDPRDVIQCVPDHNEAYHCGYNHGSIGVELCDEEQGPASRWADENSRDIRDRAALLVAQLCLAYDIEPVRPSIAELKAKGPHGIYGHNDSRLAFGNTTHSDPVDFPWDSFLKDVREEIVRLKGSGSGRKKVTRISRVRDHFKQFRSQILVKPLDAAVKAGRKGVVKDVRDQLDAQMGRLLAVPNGQLGKHGRAAKKIWSERHIISVRQLNLAVKQKEPSRALVKSIRDNVLEAFTHLPEA